MIKNFFGNFKITQFHKKIFFDKNLNNLFERICFRKDFNIIRFLTGKGSAWGYVAISVVLSIVPEGFFNLIRICNNFSDITNIIVNRLIFCVLTLIVSNIAFVSRNKVVVNESNYSIHIEYGDLLSIPDGKKVISFDECFTTKIGEAPSDIKTSSLCGQYLRKYPIKDMQELIDGANVKPSKGKSEFDNKIRYTPGIIVPNGEFLLMAFAKLDKNGRGYLTYEEYLNCLNTLWEQIDIYGGTNDIYVPILGSLIMNFNDRELTQQELLDVMISSYRLSLKKVKIPYKLHIVCKARDGFSLNNVFGVV